MNKVILHVVGPPPGKDASRSERLRWVRRLHWRCVTPLAVLGVVMLLVYDAPWYFAAASAGFEVWALAYISLDIRRQERREQTDGV